MDLTEKLAEIVGASNVLGGADMAKYASDWTGRYVAQPLAVVRPSSTAELSAVMRMAHETATPVVPVSGNTGLAGGTYAKDALMISVERLNRIREIRPEARVAVVEAGVILSALHDAVDAENLLFPLYFGARGSAMVGGVLSTNAGGSNVLRYGNTRALCLGLEVVLSDGRVMDLMTELHKDNSGYDLRDLFIGSEGTLGIISAAVLKLLPKPAAYATAMVATPDLASALVLLNRLQAASGGAVEAFEYMPATYMSQHSQRFPDARTPFGGSTYDINILVEIGATATRDATARSDGSMPVVEHLQEVLGALLAEGRILDATVAQNQTQRTEMWKRREDAAEVVLQRLPMINNDIAVPVDKVAVFLERMTTELEEIDPGAEDITVAHLGDGNIHYTVYPASPDAAVHDAITERVEAVTLELGGSFSAEHGIGLTKKPSMARRKNPVAIEVMRAIKTALDPKGILNPGKVLPDS